MQKLSVHILKLRVSQWTAGNGILPSAKSDGLEIHAPALLIFSSDGRQRAVLTSSQNWCHLTTVYTVLELYLLKEFSSRE